MRFLLPLTARNAGMPEWWAWVAPADRRLDGSPRGNAAAGQPPRSYGLPSAAGCRNRRAIVSSASTVITAGAVAARSERLERDDPEPLPREDDGLGQPVEQRAGHHARRPPRAEVDERDGDESRAWVRFCWKIPVSMSSVAPASPASVLPRITAE